jgi:serine/threonine protein kinase
MGLHYECQACGRRLTVPEELYASKIRGRMVTVKCKGCGAPVGIDGTLPPPAPAESDGKISIAATPSDPAGGLGPALNAPPPSITLAANDEPTVDTEHLGPPEPKASAAAPDRSVKAKTKRNSRPAIAKKKNSDSPKPVPPDESQNWVTEQPDVSTFAIDASWDEPVEEVSRFSHVDGPIPFRLPTALIGRYALFDQFAEGGIATVHFGRIDGAGGFSRIVAIKRLLPHLVKDNEFTEMLLKEARLAARVRHPNVVPTLDVVASQGDVLLILEYVHGESLSALCRTQAKFVKDHMPVDIAVAVMLDLLSGLCAVHEATDEKGRLLGLVHRDISPPNVVVGADGYSRVLDFGIAKALEHIEESMPNRLKGKIGYMAPEQIRGEGASQRSDVFAAGVILWELLATRRLFASSIESDRMKQIVSGNYPRLSRFRPGLSRQLDQVTTRALAVNPADRFANSREFADALEQAAARASARRVAQWVSDLAAKTLSDRARMIAQVENWNPGAEIPLNSTPFASERPLAPSSPPQAATSPAPPAAAVPAPGAAVPLAPRHASPPAAKPRNESRYGTRASLLLVLSCIVLAIALYYTLWR